MSDYVTKTHFDKTISAYVTKGQFDGAVATLRQDIRDVILYLKESQARQDERLDRHDAHFEEIESKLDALMEMSAS